MDINCIIILSLFSGVCTLGSCLYCCCDCKYTIELPRQYKVITFEPPPYDSSDPPLYSEYISYQSTK